MRSQAAGEAEPEEGSAAALGSRAAAILQEGGTLPDEVTVPLLVGRGSVLAPQPPSMRPQPSMTTGAPVVVKLNSFGRWAGRQADGMILSDPGRSARPAADGEGYAMASRRTDKRSIHAPLL